MHLAGLVWAIGVLALLLAALVSVRRIRRRVRASIGLQKGVRLCDAIDTPFLLGLFRPTVYLPSQLSQQERDVVLAHGKDIAESDGTRFCAAGEGIVDFPYFIKRLRDVNYQGVMMLHGIDREDKMPACRALVESFM